MTAAATARVAEQEWDADRYARNGRFNYEVAAPAINMLEPQSGNKAPCDNCMQQINAQVLDEDNNRTCQIMFDQLKSAGEKVLDVGCGDGAVTQQLVDAGCEVVGVNASPQLLEAARARGWVTPRLIAAGQFGIRKRSVQILSGMGTLYSSRMRTVTNELRVAATCSLQTM